MMLNKNRPERPNDRPDTNVPSPKDPDEPKPNPDGIRKDGFEDGNLRHPHQEDPDQRR